MISITNKIVIDKVFYSVKESATLTGRSQKSIREECKRGRIPHIRVGEGANARFLINLPAYLDQLNRESMGE